MPNVAVFDVTGKEVGKIDLSDAVFGIEPNAVVMHEVVVNYLANQRQGTQSALTRSEVSGALETKRHRPCETGFHPCSPVDSWRYRICSQAEKLPLYRKQEGQKIGSEVCSVL